MQFILVPGAMHGAWTWDRVRPLLEAAGHSVVAEDLPGMASLAGHPPAEQVTLALWAEAVADQVRAAHARGHGPIILVGHSRGGLVIGEAAERVPDLLAGLIYVTALLVPPGMTGREASGVSPAADRGRNRRATSIYRKQSEFYGTTCIYTPKNTLAFEFIGGSMPVCGEAFLPSGQLSYMIDDVTPDFPPRMIRVRP